METMIPGTENIRDSLPTLQRPFYTVVSSELFIGEDAADAIRSYVPGADVVVLSSVDEAARLIRDRADAAVSLVISPREGLAESALVSALQERNGALLLLMGEKARSSITACRTLTADLPFTNETIGRLLSELAQPQGR